MSAVVALFKCQCGNAATRVALVHDDEPIATINACPACVARGVAFMANIRPVFDAMIAQGVDRAIANDTMTFLIARLDAPSNPLPEQK